MNSIEISYNENGVLIKGDEALLTELPIDFDVDSVVLADDVRVDAQLVSIAYAYANASGGDVEKIGYYARLKAEFIKMYELANVGTVD